MNAKPTIRRTATALAVTLALVASSTASFAGMRDQGTAEQRAACTPDVLRLCATSLYSVNAIMACMATKKDQISTRCRVALAWN